MESTSQVGRIHCSEAAADLLKKQSPSTFLLTPRGPIEVKGKGTMQTYWVARLAEIDLTVHTHGAAESRNNRGDVGSSQFDANDWDTVESC